MNGSGWNYSDKVKEHFFHPRNILESDEKEYDAHGVGYVGSPACGDMMKVFIKVKDDRIDEMKWQTFGCASAIGSTSMLSVMVSRDGGMRLDDAWKITPEMIIDELGGLPANKIHCSVLGDKALREAIKDYYRKTGQEDRIPDDDKSRTICNCLDISEEDIRMEVLEGVKDFSSLQERTKIGTVCGQCVDDAKTLVNFYVGKYYSEEIYTGNNKKETDHA
ncbi:MAG: iron-sulfur cluster assembly scaffold protein [Candidatus Marinimicrobia bacterium]|nr:iron-sulfur cluster assembly scaffold protein [Candidatus Neomarinimicrobiota bacterium]